MANTDQPQGFKPIRHLDGTPYAGQATMYLLSACNGTAVFVGDAVSHAGSAGVAGLVVSGINTEGMPEVTQTAAGDSNIVGVVVGFLPDPTALQNKHRAASTNRIALVADDPNLIFEIQEDSDTNVLSAGEVGRNYEVVVGSGSSTTGMSAMELDSSSGSGSGLTTTACMRVLRLVPRSDNVIGTNAKWEVLIVEHYYKTATAV